jgi:hypothetical protein
VHCSSDYSDLGKWMQRIADAAFSEEETREIQAGDQVYMRTAVRSCIELASRKCLLGFTRVTPRGGRRLKGERW